MNYKLICFDLGKVVTLGAALMVAPLIVSLIYHEDIFPFLISIGVALIVGFALLYFSKSATEKLSVRDGFCIVTLSWIALSLIGCIPYYTSLDEITTFVDAFFESISGFTTTGSSIIDNVETIAHGIIFWRALTQWIGGMGVLVFILAIANRNPERSINILRAEMPGSKVDKILPKAGSTAKMLYLIYIGLTLLEVVFLLFGGMSLFDSLVHSLSTAATGGFGIKSDSVGGYSPYIQYVISIFMLLFGINFGLFYLMLIGRWRTALKSSELKWYLSIVLISVIIISVDISSVYGSISEAFRQSLFQVSSIITTTGFSTANFDLWPNLSKSVLFILMFIGGCEGSTAGGIKVSRVMMMMHSIRNEAKHTLHPRLVSSVRINDKVVSRDSLSSVTTYFGVYVITMFILFIILSFEPMSFETNFTALVTCFNNVGPGFAGVGSNSSFDGYGVLGKMILSLAMLLGRLEIYPVLLTIFKIDLRR